MLPQPIDVRIVTVWDSDEILALYQAAGWWKEWYDPAGLPVLLASSFAFAVAVDTATGRAVGMGRVLSDGVSDGYIQDVVVLPAYRKQEVGKHLITALVNACLAKGVTWIGLVATPGSVPFYEGCGFHLMPGHTPMLYGSG
jgi:GNAT superfamily N-acetyltransferase